MEDEQRIQVACPDCRERYLVEASRIPAGGGHFACRVCGETVRVPRGRAPSAPAEPSPGPTEPSPAPTETCPAPTESSHAPTEASPVPSGPAEVAASATEVECPLCGHHFSPDRKPPEPVRPPDAHRKTILVVEDTAFFRQLALDVLSQKYSTLSASTVEEARSLLGSEKVDLLVLDLSLGQEGDGLVLLDGMVEKPCPVLIFTSSRSTDLIGDGWERLRRAGADDLLEKGMNMEEEMLEKVERLLATTPAAKTV